MSEKQSNNKTVIKRIPQGQDGGHSPGEFLILSGVELVGDCRDSRDSPRDYCEHTQPVRTTVRTG